MGILIKIKNMDNLFVFDEIRDNTVENKLKNYGDGFVESIFHDQSMYIDQVISQMTYDCLIYPPIKLKSKRYILIRLEIYHILEKIISFGDKYMEDLTEPIFSFLKDIVKGNSDIIENHFFSSYFCLYIELVYVKEKYNPPDDIIEKLSIFSNLTVEEKKKYGKMRKNIMSDPLLPKIKEKLSSIKLDVSSLN